MFKHFISLGLSFVLSGSIAVVEGAVAATAEEAIASSISTELINREPVPVEEQEQASAVIDPDGGYRGSGRLEPGELVAGAIEPTFDPPRGGAPRETRGGASRAGEQLEGSDGGVYDSSDGVQG